MIAPAALSLVEAAHYLSVSADWLARSDCPRVRLGRRIVFRVVDLDAFLKARSTHAAA